MTTVSDTEDKAVPIGGHGAPTRESQDEKVEILVQEEEILDLFTPLPPLEGVLDEPNPLTFRAVIVGIILGSLVNASNVYLGE